MRITDSRAVLFESPDPVTPTPPDGALDVVMLLDRHRIPWRTLPHRPTALTVRRAARDTAAPLRGVLLIACTDQGAMAGLRAGAIVAPVPPDGDIGRARPPGPRPRRRLRRSRRSRRSQCRQRAGPLVLRDRVADHRERHPSVEALRADAIGGRGR